MPFFIIFLFFLILIPPLFSATPTTHHNCSTTSQPPHCPPFNTTPPYPFSTIPGCGHPNFHLHCTPTTSILNINNQPFTLLKYDPTTSSLLISPSKSKSKSHLCHSSIPPHPINLSHTPFKLSLSSCSRLSLLKPCSPSSLLLPNCSICPYYCTLIKNPLRLFPDGCGSTRSAPEQSCQSDVLGYLDKFLTMGILLEFDKQNDEFFSKCNDCNQNGVCGFNVSDPNNPFQCYRESVFPPTSLWVHHKKHIAEFSSVFIIICLFCFIGAMFFAFRNTGNNTGSPEDPMTLYLHNHRSASLLPPVFTYEELESSTNRFDPKRKIGDGGFGSVFLGKLLDGRTVAVKYLHRNGGKVVSTKSFCNEILILSSIQHPNLVKLHGYCSDPRGLLLVYDYIPNGTLADHLHGPNRNITGSLCWATRVDIALQIAIAVEYLHFSVQPPVVHRDITATNIFVDQYMRVRVGDFGLSRLLVCPEKNLSGELPGSSSGCVWTGPQGTPGYLDPDYHKSFRLTEKSDVFSFGVVLLELITGLKAVDQRREKREVGLVDMVVAKIQIGLLDQVVDPTLAAEGPTVAESVAAVAELAFRCVAADKDDRPDAREIVAELKRIWSRTRGVRGSNSNVVVVPAAAEG